MQRFFLPPEETQGDVLQLHDREAHHALHVVRLRAGETVQVLNGSGDRLTCEVATLARREIHLRVVARESVPRPPWRITLIQAVPKGKTFDTVIQKATELGAHRVIPLLSHRVVSQIDPEKNDAKLDHWRAIAIESVKQCGSPWLPRIDTPIPLEPLLSALEPSALRLIASLRPGARHPRVVFDEFTKRRSELRGEIQVWVGPEGDFTEGELNAIEAAGAAAITLGPSVLRADTAAIYCLAMLNYELTAIVG